MMVRPTPEYPGKRYRGVFAYEHSVVWWRETGKLVPDDWVVHHINGDKHDNRFENLTIMQKINYNYIKETL
jgi:hypothetical protein